MRFFLRFGLFWLIVSWVRPLTGRTFKRVAIEVAILNRTDLR